MNEPSSTFFSIIFQFPRGLLMGDSWKCEFCISHEKLLKGVHILKTWHLPLSDTKISDSWGWMPAAGSTKRSSSHNYCYIFNYYPKFVSPYPKRFELVFFFPINHTRLPKYSKFTSPCPRRSENYLSNPRFLPIFLETKILVLGRFGSVPLNV